VAERANTPARPDPISRRISPIAADPALHATAGGAPPDAGAAWLAAYRAAVGGGDVIGGGAAEGDPVWDACFAELGRVADGLGHARARVQRHAADIGLGFRADGGAGGEGEARRWPASPVPLPIRSDEWAGIAAGVVQRAELLERITADLHGPGRLVTDGWLPAALVAGSPHWMRQLAGVVPPGGHHLRFVAFDLGRDPSPRPGGPDAGSLDTGAPGGRWRVLADHLRAPPGAGYALENRLAVSRTLGGLQARLNVQRHAPFFAAFREGLAAACRRADPRIALLTPGRLGGSYAEQAHLARYLGLLLVEGADLAVLDDRLYVRTIGGLKRVDALWRRVDSRLLDPLATDSRSAIGVPGLIDAWAAGNAVLANAPGAGVAEAPAFAPFLPALAQALTGGPLRLPGVATWWLGGAAARAEALAMLDRLVLAPAFGVAPLGLPGGRAVRAADLSPDERAALMADVARRPQDYVAREDVRLSTMPVVEEDRLVPRPFALRVFAARGADGEWTVMPGGLVRIAHAPDAGADAFSQSAGGAEAGGWSADAWVHGPDPVPPVSLLPAAEQVHVRRNRGTLPSRVADDFYWLGRYLERGENLLAAIRLLLGHSIDADGGAVLGSATLDALANMIADAAALPRPASRDRADLTRFARDAMEGAEVQSVRAINAHARRIGSGLRDRLSRDMATLLEAPFPDQWGMLNRAGSLQRRYAAIAGLTAEHMNRSTAWRFHDLGRRLERAAFVARGVRLFGDRHASADDLTALLDLADNQITYRQRYVSGLSRDAVADLVALDPGNPRGLAYQADAIGDHLRALPVLSDDGMAEPQQAEAVALCADVATASAPALDADLMWRVERRLFRLSDLVARRYFLQGAERLRAGGLTLD